METAKDSKNSQIAKSPDEFAQKLRFRRSLREAANLPPLPPALLSLDRVPKTGAIAASPVAAGWLHLWSPLERWPEPLREVYRQDVLAAFPSQRKKETPGLEEVVLCLAVFRCPQKGFRLEERSCLFYCRGICALATLHRRGDEPNPSLSLTSIGYYMGMSRQRASLLSSRAQLFLEREMRSKRGFGELRPPSKQRREYPLGDG
ncbi:hypothetical protein MAMC_01003 [Methylacidimicrobium cyclopophantes]|uniref:Uncharacterized protein n=1 Tax=Methylacidimicrobium cyclopophantes TaxID=1041766 RepID=A0A5E6MEI3_9BACT|nr:hypothetical protein [Methylacidimicrobium cyclopophantes]VVM06233.1 hypothetical protein MAMC_01003 [Methylacidimicrobium cyclopophantes]